MSRAEHPYHPTVVLVGDPIIGAGTWIGPFCLIDGSGGLVIGAGCDIAAGVHVYSHSTTRRCVTARRHADVDRQPTSIGAHTHLGANAVVLMGTSIGSHCIVGAGAVVTHDVEDRTCVVGVPARPAGRVDPETGDIKWFALPPA
jgi:acetyltransferase-like isoleucine patch superfamily enzyme